MVKIFNDEATITQIRKNPHLTITRLNFLLMSQLLQILEVLLIRQLLEKCISDELASTNLKYITQSPTTRQKFCDEPRDIEILTIVYFLSGYYLSSFIRSSRNPREK